MKIELRQARSHEFSILERLMQLYLYDFAAIDDWPIADDGRYGNATTIESFWKDPQMTSFFVGGDGAVGGWVCVRPAARFAGAGHRAISSFSILRRHRRRGVGTEVARRVFDRYPGKWEVTQLTRNVDAQAFGRRATGEPPGARCDERPRPDGRGVMQRFDNGRR